MTETVKPRTMGPNEIVLHSICEWAHTLPDEAWSFGLPPIDCQRCAVKTETGRVLSAMHGRVFHRTKSRLEAMSKYGKIVGYVLCGD